MKLLIRSADRLSSSNSSADFQVKFSQTIFIPIPDQLSSVSLVYASIPNTIYNITSSNNSINWNDGSSTLTTTIPVGSYSSSTLSSTLATAMTTSSSGHGNLTITISFSTLTYFFTISAGSNFTLNFNSASTTMASILGFNKSSLSGSSSYTGTVVPSIFAPQHLEIRITELSKPNYSSAECNYSFLIPVPVNSGNFIEYKEKEYFTQKVYTYNNFSSLSVQLCQNGSVVSLNNADWELALAIQE